MGSLERIQRYLDIDYEPESTDAGRPPAYWPRSGDLRVENLSARYSEVCKEQKVSFSFSHFPLVWSQRLAQLVFPY